MMKINFKTFHKITYGLYVVTSEFENFKSGYIANTAFQVSSDPPMVAISSHKENKTTDIILASRVFTVSVLKKKLNTSIISEFGFMSSNSYDKFNKVKFEKKATGAPVVSSESIAWFDCKVKKYMDIGTHILIIGEVIECDILSDDEPLTYDYYREKFKMLAPKNAPTFIKKEFLENEKVQKEIEDDQKNEKTSDDNSKYICAICGFTYDPEIGDPTSGIEPGTPFKDLPDDYRCPICNAGLDYFNKA